MSIRKDFIRLATSVSGVLPLNVLCALTGHDFIIPFYHIVSDDECPHVDHLYRYKNVKEFEQDLNYLTKHYHPIAAHDLEDVLTGKYKGKKTMLLTFDDGLRQMHDTVAPILLRKGIPAIFFLNTDFIDNKDLMFRYKASLVGHQDRSVFDARNDRELTVKLSGKMEDVFEAFLRDYKPYMTTEQIRSVIGQGFSIGAHSCSHPYYADLTLTEQLSQTIDCINILKRDFGIKQKLFAFPFTDDGVSKQFFDAIFENDKVDFSFGGAGIKKDIHPRQLQRVPMEGWTASAEQILKSEYLYYLLRAPLGKNTIVRR